jgi:hypothetical protein
LGEHELQLHEAHKTIDELALESNQLKDVLPTRSRKQSPSRAGELLDKTFENGGHAEHERDNVILERMTKQNDESELLIEQLKVRGCLLHVFQSLTEALILEKFWIYSWTSCYSKLSWTMFFYGVWLPFKLGEFKELSILLVLTWIQLSLFLWKLNIILFLGRTSRTKVKGKRGPWRSHSRNGWIEIPDNRHAWGRIQASILHWAGSYSAYSGAGGSGSDMVSFLKENIV